MESSLQSRRRRPSNVFIEFEDKDVEQSIPARFEKQVEKFPDRLSVRARAQSLTYTELDRASNRIALAIIKLLGPEAEPVGLLFDQGVPAVVSILGALKAGKAYVPLDPSYPVASIKRVLEDCRPAVIVTNAKYVSLAAESASTDAALLDIDTLDGAVDPSEEIRVCVSPNQPAYIFYTSGSTGQPKGVVDTHRGVLHNVMRYTNSLHIACDDRLTLLQSPTFSGSVSSLFGALLNGAAVFPYDVKNDGLTYVANCLASERITIYHSVPSIFRRVASAGVQFPALRLIRLEGDQAQARDVELYRECFSDTCLLVNGLGATECGLVRQYFVDKDTPISGPGLAVGYPVRDMEVLILDDDARELSRGQIGEIAVRSHNLTARYWQRPDLTTKAFLEHAEQPAVRTYRTGDLGRMRADGCLELLGRQDFQMKVRGHRVDPSEIEAAIIGIDAIDEVVVQTREGPDGEQRRVAYYVVRGADVPNVNAIRRNLGDTLPEFMIPSAFVRLECLPLTNDGKVDRKNLPAPHTHRSNLECGYVAPRTSAEQRIARIWESLLDVDRVGVQDSFFDLGGNSLLGVAFMEQTSEEFGLEVPFYLIYETPTVQDIARFLNGEAADSRGVAVTDSIFALQSSGDSPPFFCLGGSRGYPFRLFELAARLGPGWRVYGMQLRGISDDRDPFDTVEDIASDLTQQILQVEPTGPYYLGGYSFGSFVAFEIARQLVGCGNSVKLLAVFDELAPGTGRDKALAERLKVHWRRFVELDAENRGRYLASRLRHLSRRFLPRPTSSASPAAGESSSRLPGRIQRVESAANRAQDRYRPSPFAGTITLFRSAERDRAEAFRHIEFDNGWSKLAYGGVEVVSVPGNHDSMLVEPHVGTVAERLRACLKSARLAGER